MDNSPTAGSQPLDVWFFGCLGEPGHYLRRSPGAQTEWNERAQPWGWKLDSGLCEGNQFQRDAGKTWTHQKDGWTAVSFWDQSGDRRGNSNSTFLVHALVTGAEVLAAARLQWPQVFNRPGFPKVIA